MTIYFNSIGKLRIGKDSDKFHPYQEREFESGWTSKTLNYNLLSGSNVIYLQNQGGHFPKKKDDVVKTFSKDSVDANGNKEKGTWIDVPWKKRGDKNIVATVSEFKKFKIDLSDYQLRRKLKGLLNKDITEITDEELKEVGLEPGCSMDDIKAASEKEEKKKKEFISEWDYVEFLNKLISSGKYEDTRFHVNGTVDCQYSPTKGVWYANYRPNNIYIAKDEEKDMAQVNATVLLSADSISEGEDKYIIYGHSMEYYGAAKKNIPMEYNFTVPNDGSKRTEKIIKMLTVDDEDKVFEIGVVLDVLNGAQTKEITLEDLDDEQRELIDLGILDFEDLKIELGGSVYGDKITENRFAKFNRKYSHGMQETAFTRDDLLINLGQTEDVFEESKEVDEDEEFDDDLFD